MNHFTCPICKQQFTQKDRTLVCPNGHAFDMAKQGYVNLLRPGKGGSVRHGDDKLMVRARTAFLDAGFYNALRDAVTKEVLAHAKKDVTLLDAGCGEGYYTEGIFRYLKERGGAPSLLAFDISKEAMRLCGKKLKGDAPLR